MEMLSLAGYPMPATVYSWTAVFVLPLNSATNPLIYTLAHYRPEIIRGPKRDSMTGKALLLPRPASASTQSSRDGQNRTVKPPPGYAPLRQFIRESRDLTPRHLLQIACSLSEQIKDVHSAGYAFGNITFDNVFVSQCVDERYLRVYLPDHAAYSCVPKGRSLRDSVENDDYELDIEAFGMCRYIYICVGNAVSALLFNDRPGNVVKKMLLMFQGRSILQVTNSSAGASRK